MLKDPDWELAKSKFIEQAKEFRNIKDQLNTLDLYIKLYPKFLENEKERLIKALSDYNWPEIRKIVNEYKATMRIRIEEIRKEEQGRN